jgi:hypothetical protein
VTSLVDPHDLDIEQRVVRIQLILQVVEVAKLATAVASRGVAEIPGRNLLQVIARRNVLTRSARRGIYIEECEIGHRVAGFPFGPADVSTVQQPPAFQGFKIESPLA